MAYKVLLLLAVRIIAEVRAYPLADVFGFAYVYHYAFTVMKIINTRRGGQRIEMGLGYMGWEGLLF
jgi:hypothetical protein